MAPDLNSVPASPRHNNNNTTSSPAATQPPPTSLSHQSSRTASRRASQIYPMSPPPLPLASPGGSMSHSAQSAPQNTAFPPLSPGLSGGGAGYVDAGGVPIRHPRPMTAAEMHLELEKEQEAVVNRLTRELSALRAHSASVASTASMASSTAMDAGEHGLNTMGGSAIYPTSSRRHRSSSSVSRSALLPQFSYPHRYSLSSQTAGPNTTSDASVQRDREHRSSSIVGTPRYEEVAMQKAELEEVKRENDVLKERIRELERMIRNGGSAGREERGRSGGRADGGGVVLEENGL